MSILVKRLRRVEKGGCVTGEEVWEKRGFRFTVEKPGLGAKVLVRRRSLKS